MCVCVCVCCVLEGVAKGGAYVSAQVASRQQGGLGKVHRVGVGSLAYLQPCEFKQIILQSSASTSFSVKQVERIRRCSIHKTACDIGANSIGT